MSDEADEKKAQVLAYICEGFIKDLINNDMVEDPDLFIVLDEVARGFGYMLVNRTRSRSIPFSVKILFERKI